MGKLIKKKITFLIDQLRYSITGLIQNLCLTTRNLYRINSIICDITSRSKKFTQIIRTGCMIHKFHFTIGI